MSSSAKNNRREALPREEHCFVCGSKNPRGLKIPFYRTTQGVEAEYIPEADLAGYPRFVHGGIISALLDEAAVWAVFAETGSYGITAELKVRFIKPMPVETSYLIKGRVLKSGGRLNSTVSEILDTAGEAIARAETRVLLKKQKDSSGRLT